MVEALNTLYSQREAVQCTGADRSALLIVYSTAANINNSITSMVEALYILYCQLEAGQEQIDQLCS